MGKRREKQLVIHCARTHMDEGRLCEVRRILEGEDLDWGYILRHCSFHLTSLLFYNLQKIDGDHVVPRSVMDKLAERYVLIFYRNTQICSILRQVLERFQNEGIPVILLKGVALGGTVYSDVDLRPSGDIDLLVKKADLQNAAAVLSEMGYTLSPSIIDYEDHHHIPPYVKLDEKLNESMSIEIHHNIAPEPLMSRIDADCLWENPQVANISGIEALVLSPENLILELCVHLSRRFSDKRYLFDISESISHYGTRLDWHYVIEKSNKWRIGSFVYYPLFLAKEVMDANVPVHVLNSLGLDPELKFFERELLKIVLREYFLRSWDTSFRSRFIRFASRSLCKEFLYSSAMHSRVRNIGSASIDTFKRVFCRGIARTENSRE